MAAVKELIRAEADGSISFGDYELASKTKKQDFEYQGDLYKVKTFREITKLERNDMFVYESVPGTAVEHFRADADSVEFQVEGPEDAQITLGMEDDTEYLTLVDGVSTGAIKTGLGGKLVLRVEHFRADADSVEFQVEGPEDAQITLGMEDDTEYLTLVDGVSTGAIKTGLGGKLVLSVELGSRDAVSVKVLKA